MKKISVGLLMLASATFTGQALAWGLPSVPAAGGSGAAVDTGAINASALRLGAKVWGANWLMGLAQVQMLKAVGDETSAQQLSAVMDESKSKKDDLEQTKKLVAATNNATAALNKVDINAKMDKSKASVAVPFALLKFGGATLLDVAAVKDAEVISKDVSKAGMSAAMDLRPAIEVGKFVAETLPGQLSSMATLTQSLMAYAKANKFTLPSKEAIAKEADGDKG
jgi:hypothetical protein